MAKFTVGHYGARCNAAILERLGGPIWSLTFLLLCSIVSSTATQILPGHGEFEMRECACPGDKLTYRCTVQGEATGATLWNGTVFSSCQQGSNEILLQHRDFTTTGGTTGTCNNGNIVGQSLSVQGDNYTSQLNVTITPDTAGKTITCAYDSLSSDQTQNMIRFSTTVPGQLPPPNKLYVSTANFVSRRLTFTWSPVAPDCPALHYNILASNCGSCPTTTNHTNVTCTDVPTDNTVCTFAIQPVMCGSLVGNRSDPISITLQDGYIITGTCTNYLIANISLVVALITSVVVFTAAIVIILRRSKAKIKELQLSNGETSHAHVESMYEDPLPSASAINTRDNVAYGHTKAVTAVM